MKNDSIGNRAWDTTGGTFGSNNWARPADLNTYLNDDSEGVESYYNTLSAESKKLIQIHNFSIGKIIYENNDLAVQIQSENKTVWNGKIGLITASEYLRANTNTNQCGNFDLNTTNSGICQTTNYIGKSSSVLWTISSGRSNSFDMFGVVWGGRIGEYNANGSGDVYPVLYLSSNINLEGEGTESNPYTIVS